MNNITKNEVFLQILDDSCGGLMYDVANKGKYDTAELVELWQNLPASQQEAAGGIVKGVFDFILN